jgi:hypothetical protein
MRIKRNRKKGTSKRNVIGKNCKFITYINGNAVCKFHSNELCNKTNTCGYEEESRTISKLIDLL